jgi:dihydrofolate reductase
LGNIVYAGTSIDGYIADSDNKLDFLSCVPNPDNDDLGFSELIDRVDAVVMGRNTYETVLGFGGEWPYSKPVFVCSRTIQDVPEELRGRVSVINGSPNEITKTLNKRGLRDLYIDGGRTIQGFLEADMIDEIILSIVPILLGGGFPLFGQMLEHRKFELLSSEILLGQIVRMSYRRQVAAKE